MTTSAADSPVDLRSDTVTQPDGRMREAARTATVGDDVHGGDPTVSRLEARAASILGKEAALYMPSGTMANQVAALVHADHGDEVIVEERSHIYGWEVAGLAASCGLQARPLDGGDDGLYLPSQLRSAIVEPSLHQAGTGLVCIENTHNHAGGVPHDRAAVAGIASVAHEHDLPIHMDGARLFNAAVALDEQPRRLVAPVDTVMCSLSKGLGAPVGSLLAGSAADIDAARRYRKRLGGGMRQAGIIAAPALVGLERWPRLGRDHLLAESLAVELDQLDGLSVKIPQTNIVLVDIAETGMSVQSFLSQCEEAGVRGVQFGPTTVRFCTHRDVDGAAIDRAITAVESVLTG